MREELIHLFQVADQDDAVRVVAKITGAGRAFCAGADLSVRRFLTFDPARREGREIRLEQPPRRRGPDSPGCF